MNNQDMLYDYENTSINGNNIKLLYNKYRGYGKIAFIDQYFLNTSPDTNNKSTGHGMSVESIIKGGVGFTGVASNTILDDSNGSYSSFSDMINYLFDYSVNKQDDVVNLSSEIKTFNQYYSANQQWYQTISQSVRFGRNKLGSIMVVAAGNRRNLNDNTSTSFYDSDPRAIVVGATNIDGTTASSTQPPQTGIQFSTPGAGVLVSTPGSSITITKWSIKNTISPTVTGMDDGTSLSAPIVSGIADLMLEANNSLNWREVQEILVDSSYEPYLAQSSFTVNKSGDWNGGGRHFSEDEGYGVVDANVAVHLSIAWNQSWISQSIIALNDDNDNGKRSLCISSSFKGQAPINDPYVLT